MWRTKCRRSWKFWINTISRLSPTSFSRKMINKMDNKTKLMKVVIVILTTFSNKDYLSLESIQLRLRSSSELKREIHNHIFEHYKSCVCIWKDGICCDDKYSTYSFSIEIGRKFVLIMLSGYIVLSNVTSAAGEGNNWFISSVYISLLLTDWKASHHLPAGIHKSLEHSIIRSIYCHIPHLKGSQIYKV